MSFFSSRAVSNQSSRDRNRFLRSPRILVVLTGESFLVLSTQLASCSKTSRPSADIERYWFVHRLSLHALFKLLASSTFSSSAGKSPSITNIKRKINNYLNLKKASYFSKVLFLESPSPSKLFNTNVRPILPPFSRAYSCLIPVGFVLASFWCMAVFCSSFTRLSDWQLRL